MSTRITTASWFLALALALLITILFAGCKTQEANYDDNGIQINLNNGKHRQWMLLSGGENSTENRAIYRPTG